jgi:ABC-type Na+ efflux pump permease subunit
MNTKTRNKGFIMLMVICILALIGIYMIILTSDANTFIFLSDRAYLEACQQNLTASGLNWAKKNADTSKTAASAVELDTADMGIKNAALSIKLSITEKGKSQVEIKTSCSKSRQRLSSIKKFSVETRP